MSKWKLKTTEIFVWAICILPLAFLCMLALSSAWRFPSVVSQHFSLQNITFIFGSGSNIGHSIFLSFLISTTVSAFCVAAAFFISKTIAFHPRRSLLVFFAYLPFVLSPVIYAACLNYYFVIAGLNGTVVGVMIAQCIIIFPYTVILFLSHWNQHILSLQQLTATLGGNTFQTLIKVLIPASKNILLVAFFQSFLISWFEFGLTAFIGIGQVQTLTVKVYQYIGEANVHLAAFSSLLLIIPPLLLLWLNKRFIFHNY